MNIGLIITGAGKGIRFSKTKNKILTPILGKPLIMYSYDIFKSFPDIKQIVITTEITAISEVKYLFLKENRKIIIIPGGKTRKESVELAFCELSSVDWVLIHDAARPLVSNDLIQRILDKTVDSDAVIPGLPATNTIKWLENNEVKETLPRDKLYEIQTPQIFAYKLLKKAYDEINITDITDEAFLIEKLNHPVKVILGETQNIKLTHPIDKTIIETLLKKI